MEKIFIIDGQELRVQDYTATADVVTFNLNGISYRYTLINREGPEFILDRGTRIRAAVSASNRDGDSVIIANGVEALGSVGGKKIKKDRAPVGSLTAPMPGKIFKILRGPGEEVKKGEPILILEAMKMEHSIRSDKDGKVKKISYQVGELVQGGAVLAEVDG